MVWTAIFILTVLLAAVAYMAGTRVGTKKTIQKVHRIDQKVAEQVEAINRFHLQKRGESFRDRSRYYLDAD